VGSTKNMSKGDFEEKEKGVEVRAMQVGKER